MSITDELREYMLCNPPAHYADFSAIAERIDKAHESKLAEVASGWDYWESTHIELPKDADGEPIHIGDTMEWVNDKSIIRTVSGVGLDVFFAWVNETERYSQCEASAYRHRHKPTVEDVLREMCLEIDRRCARGRVDYDALFTEYAEKLREVVEHDRD